MNFVTNSVNTIVCNELIYSYKIYLRYWRAFFVRRLKNTVILLIAVVLIVGGLIKFKVIPDFWNDINLKEEFDTISEEKSDNDNTALSAKKNSKKVNIETGSLTGKDDESNIKVDANVYPEWLQKMVSLNPETIDFAKEYSNKEEHIGKPIDLSKDYTKGKVPFLMQWDERWGYDYYGNDAIGAAGCGPTCLSMAYIYLKDDVSGNPRKMAEFTYDNGFYTEAGTSWYLWTDGIKELGLSGEEISFNDSTIKNSLDNGALVICSMRPGDFTTTGHYILIRGYDENGYFVNDPNRISNSQKQWTFEQLDGQVKNLWEIKAAE